MGSLSDYMENKWLDHAFGTSTIDFTNLYIGLSTADPLDTAGGIAEPSGGNYARVSCFGTGSWSTAASRATANSNTVAFAQANGAWGTISHWFICNHLTNVTWGSNVELIAHGALSTSKAIVSGNTPSIAAGQINISVGGSGSAGGMNDYLVHKLLDLTFRDAAYAAPSVYLGLCTGAQPTDAGVYTEVADANAYAREAYAGGWDAASGGATENTAAMTFSPNPTGSWGTVTYAILADGGTRAAGNLLFNGQVTSQEPNNGDTVQYAIGAFDITIT